MTTHAFFDPFGAFSADEPTDRHPWTAAPKRLLSYRELLGLAWWQLPAATRARFESHDALYTGTMTLRASKVGRCVARLCRIVGSPLPPPHLAPLAATVQVELDHNTGGSRWTRRYAFPSGVFSIASVKALDQDGKLVERLAFGLRMQLAISVRDGALCFDSKGYYLEFAGLRWRNRHYGAWRMSLPAWFLPGRTSVIHRDLGRGRFRFTMTIRHALLGELFHHDGVFRSTGDSACQR
jgi:hypothetical protein